jgi:transcriptional regulator with XRE-family HTH domain
MGRGRRWQPAELAPKLLAVRNGLELTQLQMYSRIGKTHSKIHSSHISSYENGTREPPLDVLLRYAEIAGVPLEVLVNDKIKLPDQIPGARIFEWVLIEKQR